EPVKGRKEDRSSGQKEAVAKPKLRSRLSGQLKSTGLVNDRQIEGRTVQTLLLVGSDRKDTADIDRELPGVVRHAGQAAAVEIQRRRNRRSATGGANDAASGLAERQRHVRVGVAQAVELGAAECAGQG